MRANIIKFTITFNDPDLDVEEKDKQMQRLVEGLEVAIKADQDFISA
ncbi:hypothetical protein [Nostoc sp. TCL26-01]|nr:hypothetical protein [Nostoc sp. TCL26-01]